MDISSFVFLMLVCYCYDPVHMRHLIFRSFSYLVAHFMWLANGGLQEAAEQGINWLAQRSFIDYIPEHEYYPRGPAQGRHVNVPRTGICYVCQKRLLKHIKSPCDKLINTSYRKPRGDLYSIFSDNNADNSSVLVSLHKVAWP
jgi:hypothetical protein